MYILEIINPQDEKMKFYCANTSDAYNIIDSIDNAQCPCLFQLYPDEMEAIKKSHGVIEK